MNRFQKRIIAIEKSMREHVDAYQAIYKAADADDQREPTQDERLEIESHLKSIETLKVEKAECEAQSETLNRVDELGRSLGPSVPEIQMGSEPLDRFAAALNKSIGQEFIESAGYQEAVSKYKATGALPQGFSTGLVSMKGTLAELANSGSGGAGGSAIANTVPQVVPGVVDKLFQGLTVASLLLEGQATTSSVRYVVEGTATSGAAGVAETAAKPESTLGFTTTDETIKKIATLLPVSEEMIQDAPAIQSYINGRLQLFVKIEEERQLLRGTASSAEVQGLLTSRSVPVYAGGTAVGDKPTQLFKAMNGLRGSAFLEPEWVIIHPGDWEDMRLLKDGTAGTIGQFYGGGPFQGAYGGPDSQIGQSGQVSGPIDTIWGKPVYVTGAIGNTKGTALIGTRSSAQVWRRGGLSVEATNSHSTFFALNLLAIRAEERLGLAVYRPTGFCEVRLS